MWKRFANAGLSVVLADVEVGRLASAEATVRAGEVEALSVETDVSKAESVQALAKAAVERFGGVDIVCNNAGVSSPGDPWSGPLSTWQWVMDVNFWGVVHGCRAFLPILIERGGGHIVNTASIAGLLPGPGPAYDASKHAVVALTEDLHHMVKMIGLPVGVSVVCPGWVHTSILDADRNWPTELAERPQPNAGAATIASHYRKAIDNGLAPAAVADTVIDAVEHGHFWVSPAGVPRPRRTALQHDRRARGPDASRTEPRNATPKPTRRRGQGSVGPQHIVLLRHHRAQEAVG